MCSLWKLELEEEVEPEEPVTPRHFEVPDQLVEVSRFDYFQVLLFLLYDSLAAKLSLPSPRPQTFDL